MVRPTSSSGGWPLGSGGIGYQRVRDFWSPRPRVRGDAGRRAEEWGSGQPCMARHSGPVPGQEGVFRPGHWPPPGQFAFTPLHLIPDST